MDEDLVQAVSSGDLEAVKSSVSVIDDDEIKSYVCAQAALQAARQGTLALVEWLLQEQGVPVDTYDNATQESLLFQAVRSGTLVLVKWLVGQAHANLALRNLGDHRVVHVAAELGHVPMLQYLHGQSFSRQVSVYPERRAPVHAACLAGQVRTAEWLILYGGATVTDRTVDGNTPLHLAAHAGCDDLVDALIAEERAAGVAAPSSLNHAGMTPLHVAAAAGHVSVCQLLFHSDPSDISFADAGGCNPLHRATAGRHVGVVEWMLHVCSKTQGVINAANNNGETALYIAVSTNDVQLVRLLLASPRISVNQGSNRGDEYTPLWRAVGIGNLAMVKEIADTGLCLAALGGKALALGINNGQVNIVRYLIQSGAVDPGTIYQYGNTAFHLAARTGSVEMCKALIESDVTPGLGDDGDSVGRDEEAGQRGPPRLQSNRLRHRNGSKRALLGKLARDWSSRALMLSSPAHPEAAVKNQQGKTPLHIAAKHAHLHVVQWLVTDAAVPVDAVDNHGQTAAHIAAQQAAFDVCKWLVRKGQADHLIEDYSGNTVLDTLEEGQHMKEAAEIDPGMFISTLDRWISRLAAITQISDIISDFAFVVVVLTGIRGRLTFGSFFRYLAASVLLAWAILIGLIPFLRGKWFLKRFWAGRKNAIAVYKVFALFEGAIEVLVLYALRYRVAFSVIDYVFLILSISVLVLDLHFVIQTLWTRNHRATVYCYLALVPFVALPAALSRYVAWDALPVFMLIVAYVIAVVWSSTILRCTNPGIAMPTIGVKSTDAVFFSPWVAIVYAALSLPLVIPYIIHIHC